MDERELERALERALQQDFSAGTEKFRDSLLARCLAELDSAARDGDLDDADLELLAAAGDLAAGNALFGDNGLKQD